VDLGLKSHPNDWLELDLYIPLYQGTVYIIGSRLIFSSRLELDLYISRDWGTVCIIRSRLIFSSRLGLDLHLASCKFLAVWLDSWRHVETFFSNQVDEISYFCKVSFPVSFFHRWNTIPLNNHFQELVEVLNLILWLGLFLHPTISEPEPQWIHIHIHFYFHFLFLTRPPKHAVEMTDIL